VVLILALWLVSFLSMMVLTFLKSERIELRVATGFADRFRARELAKSGVVYAVAVLGEDDTPYDSVHDRWKSSSEDFREHVLGEDGYFSLIHNNLGDQAEMAYGITDENGKINLNQAPREVLAELPGMTDDLAEAVEDWRDTNDQTGSGAESAYYQTLEPPYAAKNGPFDTVEELLFVRGMTPELLYGEDANRNGVLDANENDGDETYPPDDNDGVLDGGLIDFLTVYSYEQNVAADGTKRVNINADDVNQMRNELRSVLGEHIGDARAAQVAGEIANYRQIMKRLNSSFKFASTANVLAPVTSLSPEEFKLAADYLTTTDDQKIEGLVNISTAPREVIAAVCRTLQGFEDQDVDELVAFRAKEESDLSSIAWVLEALGNDNTKFQLLAPFITVRSGQFLAHSVGVIAHRKIYYRLAAVMDRVPEEPVVLYWKDQSGLGVPFEIRSVEAILEESQSTSGG
jgi:type II secretory pathway component PulK